jgi:hypothetical protein
MSSLNKNKTKKKKKTGITARPTLYQKLQKPRGAFYFASTPLPS